MTVQTRHDSKRGCGWRKPGGLYLVAEGPARRCGLLPIMLERCPVCNHGIKPSRGWTWIEVAPLLPLRDGGGLGCEAPASYCVSCALPREGRHGLLWIGEQFYPTPQDWLNESQRQGVSRRITALPKGFKLGETWALVAHRKAVLEYPDPAKEGVWKPAIFHAFRPSAVEYVVKGDESEEKLGALEKRGITPIRVVQKMEPIAEPALALPEGGQP